MFLRSGLRKLTFPSFAKEKLHVDPVARAANASPAEPLPVVTPWRRVEQLAA